MEAQFLLSLDRPTCLDCSRTRVKIQQDRKLKADTSCSINLQSVKEVKSRASRGQSIFQSIQLICALSGLSTPDRRSSTI